MSSELIIKAEEYRKALQAELKNLKEERKVLVSKVGNGEKLSAKENLRNKEISELINDVEGKLAKFEELDFYNDLENKFNDLTKKKIKKAEKEKISKDILAIYRKSNKNIAEEIEEITLIDKKDLKDLNKAKETILGEIEGLEISIDIMEKRDLNTEDIKNELKAKKEDLELIDRYACLYVDEKELKNDLENICKSSTKDVEKLIIINKYTSGFEYLKNSIAEDIIADMQKDELVENEKEATNNQEVKKDLSEKDEKLKKTLKVVAAVGGVALATAILVYAIKHADLNNTNDTTKNNTNDYNTEQQVKNNPNINKLMNKGYDEVTATLMCNNFSNDTINAILNRDYSELFKLYATAKGFDINYLNDYEVYRSIYNITPAKTVDYVNRSYKIKDTKFYNEVEIDNIINVVMAIDNKTLFNAENAQLAQSINTSFNRIVDNYLFGTTTKEDVNKLDAISYFAKENSDLGNFLKGFSNIAKTIISNPEDKEAKKNMTDYIKTFATSLNGFTNDARYTNEDAKVNDYFDWYMAYNSFVGPLGDVLSFPRELQSVDLFYAEEIYRSTILLDDSTDALEKQKAQREQLLKAYGYGEYIDSIFNLFEIYDTRELMHTALNDPEICRICGQNLGGR